MDRVEPFQRELERVSLDEDISGVPRLGSYIDTGDVEARELIPAGSPAST